MIKKVTLTFFAKFWWLLVHYKLYLNAMDGIFTWDGSSLIAIMMARYDIDFTAIIWCKLYERDFGGAMTLSFLCLVQ